MKSKERWVAADQRSLEAELKKTHAYHVPVVCQNCPGPDWPFEDGECCEAGREELLIQLVVSRTLNVDITQT